MLCYVNRDRWQTAKCILWKLIAGEKVDVIAAIITFVMIVVVIMIGFIIIAVCVCVCVYVCVVSFDHFCQKHFARLQNCKVMRFSAICSLFFWGGGWIAVFAVYFPIQPLISCRPLQPTALYLPPSHVYS